jgi:hypothetical protein
MPLLVKYVFLKSFALAGFSILGTVMQICPLTNGESKEMIPSSETIFRSETISTSRSLRRLSAIEPYQTKMTTETSNNMGSSLRRSNEKDFTNKNNKEYDSLANIHATQVNFTPEPTTKANCNVKVFVIVSQSDLLQVSFSVEN